MINLLVFLIHRVADMTEQKPATVNCGLGSTENMVHMHPVMIPTQHTHIRMKYGPWR